MKNNYVDMHIHSYYSDGTMSVNEILNQALEKGVKYISITDHDLIEGTKELISLAKDKDIICISGVEIDAIENDINYHILAYDFDVNDKDFNNFLIQNRNKLDYISDKLIELMAKDNQNVSIDEYTEFKHDKTQGGWKALQYFQYKNITNNLYEGYPLYSKYNCSYQHVGFNSIKEVVDIIHKANGKAILAHPGKVIDNKIITFKLNEIIKFGIDGIECYYPTHSKEVTKACLKICTDNNLLITCGSDCHGSFERTKINEMKISINDIRFDFNK